MRRLVRALLMMTAAAVLGAAPAAPAQDSPALDIRIEPDLRPRTSVVSALSAVYRVTLTDAATGASPTEGYLVSARAVNADGEESEFFACGRVSDVDSRTPPGVFDCTVIVDHGGAWEFVAVVSQEREGLPPLPVGQNSVPFELETSQSVEGINPDTEVKAGAGELALLLGHSALAAGWFACVGLLAVLTVPAIRRRLSTVGAHQLERRLDLIIHCTWASAGLTVATGAYLTLTQAAYDPPSSPSEVEAVFSLPYGKPYFVTLAVKIGLYLMMMAASVALIRDARRRMLSPAGTPVTAGQETGAESRSPGLSGGRGGAVAVADPEITPLVDQAAPEERRAPGGVRLGLACIAAGAVGVWVCVAVLKYAHELIEASRALL